MWWERQPSQVLDLKSCNEMPTFYGSPRPWQLLPEGPTPTEPGPPHSSPEARGGKGKAEGAAEVSRSLSYRLYGNRVKGTKATI